MQSHPTSEVWASEELLEATRAGFEIWRPVPNTEGRYEVSNLGAARSWACQGSKAKVATSPRQLRCGKNGDGYPMLQICIRGTRRMLLLHNAICEAFIGPRPGPGTIWQGAHQNDDRLDNRLTNLKWCTQSVNQFDQVRNGRAGKRLRECREIEGVKHYLCTGCETWKAEAEFGRLSKVLLKQSRCGLRSECRLCGNARRNRNKRAKAA